MVNILFGQPMGQQSLFARIFSLIMGKEIKKFKKQIEELSTTISNKSVTDILMKHFEQSRSKIEEVRRISCKFHHSYNG